MSLDVKKRWKNPQIIINIINIVNIIIVTIIIYCLVL